MRAIVCRELGETEGLRLEEVAPPTPGPGEVRLALHAAGINFADTLFVAGKYQEKRTPPFTPGFEAAGVVAEVGAEVTSLQVGDRVLTLLDQGAFAEEAVARESDVLKIPDSMDFVTAAGFPVAYGTSHMALLDRARLRSGETLLVHGAAGGVGLTAVEIGHCLGARVIATAGGAAKLAVAQEHGADVTIDYRSEDVRARVKELTDGRGADVIYDPVGGEMFDASLRSVAPDGRIVVVGFASGTIPQIPANILLVKNVTVIGLNWPAYRRLAPERLRASLLQALAWVDEGRLHPHISRTFDLADAIQALDTLKRRGSTGKLVLTMGR